MIGGEILIADSFGEAGISSVAVGHDVGVRLRNDRSPFSSERRFYPQDQADLVDMNDDADFLEILLNIDLVVCEPPIDGITLQVGRSFLKGVDGALVHVGAQILGPNVRSLGQAIRIGNALLDFIKGAGVRVLCKQVGQRLSSRKRELAPLARVRDTGIAAEKEGPSVLRQDHRPFGMT